MQTLATMGYGTAALLTMDIFSIATLFGLRHRARQAKQEDGYTRAEQREEGWYGISTPSLATTAEAELMQSYDDQINKTLLENE